jgi:hypothetical protein
LEGFAMAPGAVINVWCPACNKKLGFPATAVGRKAKCPACEHVFVVEAQPERAPAGPAQLVRVKDGLIRVECPSCAKISKFKLAAAGKKARCSACDQMYIVPQPPDDAYDAGEQDAAASEGTVADLPSPAGSPAAPRALELDVPSQATTPSLAEDEPPAPREEDGLFDVLANAEQSAESAEGEEQMIARMQAAQAAAATKSAASSFQSSIRAGERIASESEPNIGEKLLGAVGPLGKGIAFSCTGAVVGALIWYGIAKSTGYEIGYVAWVVGILAGFGMHLGVRAESGIAGGLAALIAFCGILGGKMLVVAWVIFPLMAQESKQESKRLENDIEMQREEMVDIKSQQILAERSLNPEKLSEEQEEQIQQEAEKRVDKMKDAEVRSQYKAWKAAHPEEAPKPRDLNEIPTGVFVLFVAVLFGIKGIIFSILAMITAYKIGSSGVSLSGD